MPEETSKPAAQAGKAGGGIGEWVSKHPVPAIMVAAGVGVLLLAMMGGGSKKKAQPASQEQSGVIPINQPGDYVTSEEFDNFITYLEDRWRTGEQNPPRPVPPPSPNPNEGQPPNVPPGPGPSPPGGGEGEPPPRLRVVVPYIEKFTSGSGGGGG